MNRKKNDEDKAKLYETLVELVNREKEVTVRGTLLGNIDNVTNVGEVDTLVKFINAEIGELNRIRNLIIKDFPDRHSFVARLDWYLERFRYKKKKVEELAEWQRMLFVLGTYDSNVRNIECHFHCPINLKWEKDDIDDAVQDVMEAFLKDAGYDIPQLFDWDNNFGSQVDPKRPKTYSKEDCPNDFMIEVFDYDKNTRRSYSEFDFGIDWIDHVEDLKIVMRSHLVLNRGSGKGKSGRPKSEGTQTNLGGENVE